MSSYRRAEPVEGTTGFPAGQGAAKASSLEVEFAVALEKAWQIEERLADMRAALEKAEARAEAAQARADAAQERVAGLLEGPLAEPKGWWARLVGK